MVNPIQVRKLLDVVPKVGRKRGPRLKALFACVYYAVLRPEEAADLRLKDRTLPVSRWGQIILERARPQATKRWTNSGETHESPTIHPPSVRSTPRGCDPPDLR